MFIIIVLCRIHIYILQLELFIEISKNIHCLCCLKMQSVINIVIIAIPILKFCNCSITFWISPKRRRGKNSLWLDDDIISETLVQHFLKFLCPSSRRRGSALINQNECVPSVSSQKTVQFPLESHSIEAWNFVGHDVR